MIGSHYGGGGQRRRKVEWANRKTWETSQSRRHGDRTGEVSTFGGSSRAGSTNHRLGKCEYVGWWFSVAEDAVSFCCQATDHRCIIPEVGGQRWPRVAERSKWALRWSCRKPVETDWRPPCFNRTRPEISHIAGLETGHSLQAVGVSHLVRSIPLLTLLLWAVIKSETSPAATSVVGQDARQLRFD